jgi:hypothetical protein
LPIPGLAPGTYFLKVYLSPHYNPSPDQWYDGARTLAAATPIRVPPGGTLTRITMHLQTWGE